MKKILTLSLSIAIVYIVSSEVSIAFAWDSTFLFPEPVADFPAPDEISPAESPALDISPYAVSTESTQSHSMPLKYFDVTHYGAVADGRTDSSSAFLATWKDACSYTGHSTFLVPKGIFYSGSVSFSGPCHNNGSPKVEIMGTLKAPISLKDFPNPEWIVFKNLRWFNLTGLKSNATFDGEGQESWSKAACRRVMKCHNFPAALKFVNVSHGIVRDISLLNSKAVHVSIHKCKNLDLSGFHIQAPGTSPNTDGITISQSNNITITSSTIEVGDDCVAIGPGSTSIHVSFVNCGPGHGISVGSLGKRSNEKDVNGVHVSNCTINGTKNGVRVKTWSGAPPGHAYNLMFENISMINVSNPIIIDQTYCPSGICKSNKPSKVKLEDVKFKNIAGTYNSMYAVTLRCSSVVPCKKVLLADINLKNIKEEENLEKGHFLMQGGIHDLQLVNSQF